MTQLSNKPAYLPDIWGIRHFSTTHLVKKKKKKVWNVNPNITEPREESK